MQTTYKYTKYLDKTCFFRGDNFPKTYSQIAQLHAFLPTATPVIALTATATKKKNPADDHS